MCVTLKKRIHAREALPSNSVPLLLGPLAEAVAHFLALTDGQAHAVADAWAILYPSKEGACRAHRKSEGLGLERKRIAGFPSHVRNQPSNSLRGQDAWRTELAHTKGNGSD